MGRSGVPDVVCCYAGRFIGIECKAGGNKPTTLQKRELEAIKVAGGLPLIINEDNYALINAVLDKLEKQ